MKEYTFKGWAPLRYRVFIPICSNDDEDWLEPVTDSTTIRIHLCSRFCLDKEKSWYKEYSRLSRESELGSAERQYSSKSGFTKGEVCSLIVQTYMKAVDELFEGEYDVINNLSLTSFAFDKKTLTVYPSTDS